MSKGFTGAYTHSLSEIWAPARNMLLISPKLLSFKNLNKKKSHNVMQRKREREREREREESL